MDRTIIEGALTAPNLWFECFEKVTSTNDLLKEMAAQGAPERGVMIAEAQTAGKGRKERVMRLQKKKNGAPALFFFLRRT